MKNILFHSVILILLTFVVDGCSSRSALTIEDNPITSDRNLRINSNVKHADFGVSFIFGLNFRFSWGGDRMDSVMIYDQGDSLLWKIIAKESIRAGAIDLNYGRCPGGYIQLFPFADKEPADLINNQKYRIDISLQSKLIRRNFYYYPSTIYLGPDGEIDSLAKTK